MIASLRGILSYSSPENLIIDVGGVGYSISFCQAGLRFLPETGQEVFLHIYTKVREDSIELFGFIDPSEKEMFSVLLGVSGVGPKLALSSLSAASPAELARAIMSDDLTQLVKLPGIGKKTAERLCLELKDKVQPFAEHVGGTEIVNEEAVVDDQLTDDVISALVNLGYPQSQAKKALHVVLNQLPDNQPEPPIEEILRLALRSLA